MLTYLFGADVPFPAARHRAVRVGPLLGRGADGAPHDVLRLLRIHLLLHLAGRAGTALLP